MVNLVESVYIEKMSFFYPHTHWEWLNTESSLKITLSPWGCWRHCFLVSWLLVLLLRNWCHFDSCFSYCALFQLSDPSFLDLLFIFGVLTFQNWCRYFFSFVMNRLSIGPFSMEIHALLFQEYLYIYLKIISSHLFSLWFLKFLKNFICPVFPLCVLIFFSGRFPFIEF